MIKQSNLIDTAEYDKTKDYVHYFGEKLEYNHSFAFAPDVFEKHAAVFDVNKEGYVVGIWLFTASKKFNVTPESFCEAVGFDINLNITDEKINLMVSTKIDGKICNYQCDGYYFSKCKELPHR